MRTWIRPRTLLVTVLLLVPAALVAAPAEAATVVTGAALGGALFDGAAEVVLDPLGFAYVVGTTMSSDFPVVSALQASYGGSGPVEGVDTGGDLFVAKVDPLGNTVWATFLGGSGGEFAQGIALDGDNNVYVTGFSASSDFPTTTGAAQPVLGGGQDLVVAKLTSDGSALVYATFVGGAGREIGSGIAVDAAGNAFVGGDTTSSGWGLSGGWDASYNGGFNDAFLVKIAPDGGSFVAGTFFGGSSNDEVDGLALDPYGNVLVTGYTQSANYPVVNATDPTYNGGPFPGDAHVAKFPNDLGTPVFATYLGGTAGDGGHHVVGDLLGRVHVIGNTASADFPLVTPIQAVMKGPSDAFVATYDAQGGALLFSTFLGGSGTDPAWGIAYDELRARTYAVGWSSSSDFPQANALQTGHSGGQDLFVAEIDEGASALRFSSLLGGSGDETQGRPAVMPGVGVVLAGASGSVDFPVLGYTNQGGSDAILARLAVPLPVIVPDAVGVPGDNGWFVSDIQVTLDCAAPSATSIRYAVDTGALAPYGGPFALAEGDHDVAVDCTDAHGNSATSVVNWQVDTTRPVTYAEPVEAPGNNGWYLSALDVDLQCVDATSGCAVSLARQIHDGEPCCAFTATGFHVGIDGIHTLGIQSIDFAGNVEEEFQLVLMVDSHAPETTAEPVGLVGDNGWFRSPVDVSYGCTDLTSGCASTLAEAVDPGEPCCAFAPGSVAVTTEGVHPIQFTSEDVAGNVEQGNTVEIRVDSVAPQTTAEPVGVVGSGGWFRSAVQLGFACSDATSGCAHTSAALAGAGFSGLSIDALPLLVWPWGQVDLIGDGVHEVRYSSQDVAGNAEAEATVLVSIDATAPVTTASYAGVEGAEGWFRSPVEVGLDCVDATSGCAATTATIDDAPISGSTTVDADGEHVLRLMSVDVAGNAEPERTEPLRIDQTPPLVDLVAPQQGFLHVGDHAAVPFGVGPCPASAPPAVCAQWDALPATVVVGPVTLRADATDATSGVREVRFLVDDVVVAVSSGPLFEYVWNAGAQALGEHTLQVVAVDVAGNEAASGPVTVFTVPTDAEGVAGTIGPLAP